ncbi:MAG: hypothetical protein B6D64_05435 [Bacteroidetes bacterium 4484_276]|nr:MAG: hypothetical protein B6D64_05435 [Bacteroidetes bacterium 4484_276]
MILPRDIKPEYSLYFIGGKLLETIKKQNATEFDLLDLFQSHISSSHDCSFNQYLLAIDWLYLLNLVSLNNEGQLQKCF